MLFRKLYYYLNLTKTQYWSKEKLSRYQSRKLENLLKRIYQRNEFYREKWDEEGFHPDDFETIEDIDKIPYTTREELTENFPDKVMTDEIRYSRSTSGSTGKEPLKVAFNEKSFDFSEAVYLRSLRKAGYKPWEKKIYYWYEDFEDAWYNKFFMRKKLVRSDKSIEEQIKILEEVDANTIYYYGGILYTIAKVLKQREDHNISPNSIITHAEILTPKMKELIEEVFEAKVHDEYGTTEFNRMAWTCEEGNYHLDMESVYFEFEDTELGKELVATSLVKDGMPMIRYRMGDIVELNDSSCSCNLGLESLSKIKGRKKNFINNISPYEIIDEIADIYGLKMFQIVNNSTRLELRYVKNHKYSEKDLKKAKERLEDLLDKEVFTKEVKDIKRTDGGKIPLVLNQEQ